MKLRIAETAWDALKAQLLAREDVETAGILLGRHADTSAGETVAVEHSFALPDEGFVCLAV